jgi:hypothetical protein
MNPIEIVRANRQRIRHALAEPSYCKPNCRCAQWDRRQQHLIAQQRRGVLLGISVPDRPICGERR